MNKTLTSGQVIAFGVPVLFIGLIIFISRSSMFQINPGALSIGITVDLLLTVPVIHFFLIRKTNTSGVSILSFFVIGLVVASLALPVENQQLLEFAKAWILPVIEVAVIGIAAYKVREAMKDYNRNDEAGLDFYAALKHVSGKILPRVAAALLTSEIAVIYYGFVRWKKRIPGKYEFTYHKNSGTVGLLVTIIFLVIAETSILHLLLARWNQLAAWIVTGLSIYTAIQLFGFLKSITRRPIVVTADKLILRYGILNEAIVNIKDIESIDLTTEAIEFNKMTRRLSVFGTLEGHNVIIRLKREVMLSGLYGINRNAMTIALHVDNREEFKRQLGC